MSRLLMRLNDGEPALDSHTFVLQTLRALWDNLPQLLAGMVWLNLCLAPALALALLGLGGPAAVLGVLLAAPGWVALQHVQGQLVQGKSVPYAALLTSLRRFWLQSVRLGALGLAPPAVTYVALLGANQLAPGLVAPLLAAGAAASVLAACLLILYAVPLLVLHDQNAGAALRNSLVLSARYFNNTLGMAALAVLCGLAVLYVNSGLLFVLPVLYGMFVINNCRLVLSQEEVP